MTLRTDSCKERSMEIAIVNTVICTVEELMKTITIKVTSWTMFLVGILLYSSEFLLYFANVILHMLSFSTSYLQNLDLQY
jgi:hypothetical protein